MPARIIYTPSLLGQVAKAAGLMNSYSLPILTFVKLPHRGAWQLRIGCQENGLLKACREFSLHGLLNIQLTYNPSGQY